MSIFDFLDRYFYKLVQKPPLNSSTIINQKEIQPETIGTGTVSQPIYNLSGTDITQPTPATEPGGSALQIQYNVGDGTFGGDAQLTYNSTTHTLFIGSSSSQGFISTPSGKNLNLVTGTNGSFEALASGTGAIDITASSGSISISTSTGGIDISSTSGGNMAVRTTGSGYLHLYTSSGMIDISAGAGSIDINNSTGGIDIDTGNSDITLYTNNGSIILNPGISPGTIQFMSYSGINAIFGLGTLASSDKTFTFPNLTGTFALTANNLSVFAATTSSQLAGVISDETGTGLLVFQTSPTIITPTIAKLANLTSNGFVKTSAGDGTLSVDTNTYSKVVASVFEKSETGTDANVLTYATGGSDEFLGIQIATDVSAITGTSIAITVTWKDSNNSTATSTLTLSAVGDGTIDIPINSKASQNVVVSTVFVGVSTAYKISAFITKLN